MSFQAAASVAGFVWMGWLADRFTARRVLPWALGALGASILMLFGARHGLAWQWWLGGYVILFGRLTCRMHLFADARRSGGNAGIAPLRHFVGSDPIGLDDWLGWRSFAGRRGVRRYQQLRVGVRIVRGDGAHRGDRGRAGLAGGGSRGDPGFGAPRDASINALSRRESGSIRARKRTCTVSRRATC